MKKMTQKEYVGFSGQKCPNCRSYDICPITFNDIEGCKISVGMECIDCSTTWTHEYTVTGYSDLVVPKEKKQ